VAHVTCDKITGGYHIIYAYGYTSDININMEILVKNNKGGGDIELPPTKRRNDENQSNEGIIPFMPLSSEPNNNTNNNNTINNNSSSITQSNTMLKSINDKSIDQQQTLVDTFHDHPDDTSASTSTTTTEPSTPTSSQSPLFPQDAHQQSNDDDQQQKHQQEQKQEQQRQKQRRRRKRQRRQQRRRQQRDDDDDDDVLEMEMVMAYVRNGGRFAAGVIASICFGWFAFYMCTAWTDWGDSFYPKLKARLPQFLQLNGKGADAILYLAIPLLLSATLTHFLHHHPTSTAHERGHITTTPLRIPNPFTIIGLFRHKTVKGDGDPNYTFLGILLFVLPTLTYLALQLNDALRSDVYSHRHVANIFGKTSMMAMSYFLIPVSRHSILLTSMGWDPIHAAQLHTCAGYVAVLGGLAHGVYYVVIYVWVTEVGLVDLLVPDWDCWSWEVIFGGGETVDFGCYMQFMNLTGVFSAFCFFMLTLTSIWWVRRRYYNVFYTTHIIFGTSVFLGLAMHWNAMILYICPSMIYYLASLGPYVVKAVGDRWRGGTKIVGVRHIVDSGDCVEVAFCLGKDSGVKGFNSGVTALKMCATQYIRICIPEISPIWHPFTCYSTPSISNVDNAIAGTTTITNTTDGTETLNVIFRCYGTWTTNLAKRLADPSLDRPTILVDGFYGPGDRLSQALRHDTLVMVAGGIGIVSYISMVRLLHLTLMVENVGVFPTKKVVLLWICRDEGLIDHLVKTQFDRLVRNDIENGVVEGVVNGCGVAFHIIIFHTARNAPSSSTTASSMELTPTIPSYSEILLPTVEHSVTPSVNASVDGGGEPFDPTSSSMAGKSAGISEAILSSLVFASIAWGGLYIIWDKYQNVQKHSSAIGNRMYSTLELVALSIVAPLAAAVILKCRNVCVRLYKRVGRYRYDALTSVSRSDVAASATGCAEGPIAVGMGVCTTELAVLPNASPHVREQEPLVDIGYDSLKVVEENVLKEMTRTNSCNGGSSGDTSVSSTTQSDESIQHNLPLDQVSTVTTNNVGGGAHTHTDDNDSQSNTTTNSTIIITPSLRMTTGDCVEINHRRGRPNMEELLTELFETSESPGIFMCGPALLLNAVKDVVVQSRFGGGCTDRSGNGRRAGKQSTVLPRCALYEEGFEV